MLRRSLNTSPLRVATIALGVSLLAGSALVGVPVPARASGDIVVQGPTFAVHVNQAGDITSIVFSDGRTWALGGLSLLTDGSTNDSCTITGQAQTTTGGGATWTTRCTDTAGHATDLVDTLGPTASSVSWSLSVKSENGTYSKGIATRLSGFTDTHARLFWTSSGQSTSSWADPLSPASFVNMTLPYGGHATFGPPQTGFSVPIATIIEPDTDHSLSLAQSLNDPILDAQLVTSNLGDIQMTRFNNRITTSASVVFQVDLVASAADWRGGLQWMTQKYPTYFTSGNPKVDQLGGLGSYSAYPGPFTPAMRQRMNAQDFRTNWELSLHGPYFGEFIPPVSTTGQLWVNYIVNAGLAPGPIYVSVDSLRRETSSWTDAGFKQLAYFNTAEFGDNNTQTAQAPSGLNCSDPFLWQYANSYLYCTYPNAILRNASGNPFFSYNGTLVMDSGDSAYRQHLLDQAAALMTNLPDYSGINIDRMDWLEQYNVHADDGISWVNGGPARSLITSWKSLMSSLTAQMHTAGKQVWVSPTDAKRIDELAGVDGIQSEFNNGDAFMNLDAFMGVDRPVIGWNYTATDALIQHYLYMGVNPQSDIPQNDHGLLISAAAEQLYRDYAPMISALQGKRWLLTPHAVSVSPSTALANAFTTPDGVVVPIIAGGSNTQATVSLTGLLGTVPDLDLSTAQYLVPGSTSWTSISATTTGNVTQVTVPLARGTAFVRIPTHSIESGLSNLSQPPLSFNLSTSSQWVSSTHSVTLTGAIRNRSTSSVASLSASVTAPIGWTVTRTDGTGATIAAGQSANLTWTVSAQGGAAGAVAEIRPQIGYSQGSQQYSAADTVRLVGGDPVPAGQLTATASSSLSGYPPSNAVDGDQSTFWHSDVPPNASLPQSITLDMGRSTNLSGLAYVGRQDGSENGLINRYNVYTSPDGVTFTKVASGSWAWDMGLHTAQFVASTRFVRLESVAGYGNFASAAEVTPILQPERTLPQSAMTATATSAQSGYPASNAIDGNTATIWHSQFNPYVPLPQSLTLALGSVSPVNQVTYLPRQDGSANGNITTYNVYTSPDGTAWTLQSSGNWPDDATQKSAAIPTALASFVRLEATAGHGGFASAAEVSVQQPAEAALAQASTSATASSAQSGYPASNAIDGNTATIWHSQFNPYQPLPVSITLNLSGARLVNQLRYLPRQDGSLNGDITAYNIYTSSDGSAWTLQGSGTWPDDTSMKSAAIPPTVAGFVRLEATAGHGGFASAAELVVQQPVEGSLPRGALTATATSAQTGYAASNAIDGSSLTIWHSQFNPTLPLPQSITVGLGGAQLVNQLSYLPRQDGYPQGTITAYNLYTSPDGTTWTLQGGGNWRDDSSLKTAGFPAITTSFVRLEATAGDGGWASAAEISIQQPS